MRADSELKVITKSKKLIEYVFCISEKSPKKFRLNLTNRIINLSLEVLEMLVMANETMLTMSENERLRRRNFQHDALAKLRILDALAFHIYMTETGKIIKKLRNSSKKRFKNRMKKMNKQFNNGEIEMSDIQKVLPGFNGHMKRGDTWNFRKSVMSMLAYNNRGAMENQNISALTAQAKQLALEISAVRTNIGETYWLNNLYKSGTEIFINLIEANEMTYNEDKTFYITQARKSVKETMVFLLSLKESGIIDKKLYSELNNKSKNILLSIRKLEL